MAVGVIGMSLGTPHLYAQDPDQAKDIVPFLAEATCTCLGQEYPDIEPEGLEGAIQSCFFQVALANVARFTEAFGGAMSELPEDEGHKLGMEVGALMAQECEIFQQIIIKQLAQMHTGHPLLMGRQFGPDRSLF